MSPRLISIALLAAALGGFSSAPDLAAGSEIVEGRLRVPLARAGSVEGNVRVELSLEAAPPMLSPYARRRYRPPSPAAEATGSPNEVVVYLLSSGRTAPGAAPVVAITQRNRTILPHVAAIQVGTRVRFPNEDDVFHNLFSLSDAHPFNLGRYAPGDTRVETFRNPGIVRMFCDIHSEMAGVILVLDTEHFTRPDAAGGFRLDGLPDGRHRLVAWHVSAGADTATVEVRAGRTTRIDFLLPG